MAMVWLEPQERCDVSVRIVPPAAEREEVAVMVVHASCELLSSIPYFATSLSAPWQAGKENTALPEITLECAAGTCPADYCQCLQFLKPKKMDLKWTVDNILKVLRPADYLDYQDCAELCMKYLASVRWSDADEVAVHDAFAGMGMKPSHDLLARLEPIQNAQELFKEILLLFAHEAGENPKVMHYQLADFVKAAVSDARQKVSHMSRVALMEAWITVTEGVIKGEANKRDLWVALTEVSLQHGDEVAVMNAFIERCGQLSYAVHTASMCGATFSSRFTSSFEKLLERVVPHQPGAKPIVLLSNEKRASLVAALMPIDGHSFAKGAIERLVSTLPLQHPVVKKLYRNVFTSRPSFWCSKLFLAMDRSEEAAAPNHSAGSNHAAD